MPITVNHDHYIIHCPILVRRDAVKAAGWPAMRKQMLENAANVMAAHMNQIEEQEKQ